MVKNVYISYTSSEYSRIYSVKDFIQSLGYQVSFHKKGDDYVPEKLDVSDAVVFVFERAAFTQDILKMTRGQMKEYIRAVNLRKPIFLYYVKKGGEIGIYATEVNEEFVLSGIIGTMNTLSDLKNLVRPEVKQEEDLSIDDILYSSGLSDEHIDIVKDAVLSRQPKNFY